MSQPPWVPPGINLSRPSVARVYDYFLGGFHNFPVDRQMAEAAIAAYPLLPAAAKASRDFMARAVTHLAADLGVRQFLDLGSGIPTVGNVHELVQAVDPLSRVVYVDIDPIAVAHSEAILADNPCTVAVQADLRRPELILGLPPVTELIRPDEPTALLMMSVLHFVGDHEHPADLVRRYRKGIGPQCWLALSHGTHEFHAKELAEGFAELYARTPTPLTPRTRSEVLALLDGFELQPPGLVLMDQWRPGEVADVPRPERFAGWAGIARAS